MADPEDMIAPELFTQLLAGIAHELNNQLGVVTGNAELLMRKVEGDDLQFVREIVRAGGETRETLKHIAALASRPSKRSVPIRVDNLVQTGIDWLSVQYQVRAEIEITGDRSGRQVQVEVMQCAQSLADIFRYARHSCLDESVCALEAHIVAPETDSSKSLSIDIIDHNQPLEAAEQSMFFEPYPVIESRTKPGLGLFVARHRLRQMGGDAFVAESNDERTVFRVELPLVE